jgi:hypothetical protein
LATEKTTPITTSSSGVGEKPASTFNTLITKLATHRFRPDFIVILYLSGHGHVLKFAILNLKMRTFFPFSAT